jgi:hypothetical protein
MNGCPERMKGLLREWGWIARGGGCGTMYFFAKQGVELHDEMIEEETTVALTVAVRAELEWGRPKVEVAKSVVPVLLEGLDETVKQNGIFSTMRIVAETLEKMIEGTFRIPMDEIISQTVADRREQEQEHEMVRGYSSQLGK